MPGSALESVSPAGGCARPPPSVAPAEGRGLHELHVRKFNLKLQPHMTWITCTCRLKCYLVKVYLILLFLAGEVSSQESFPPRGTSGRVLAHTSAFGVYSCQSEYLLCNITDAEAVLLLRPEPQGQFGSAGSALGASHYCSSTSTAGHGSR